jgi:hypothetical protein
MLKFVLPVLFSLFFLAPSAFGQEKSCVITLKNGNTINADSCRVKGGRIYLKYRLGEVSFDLSKVKSITGENGSSNFLQDKGKAQPARTAHVAPGNAQPPEENSQAQVEKDRKFNNFFDKYWQADEKTQEQMDKQMDKVFSDYFDDSDSDQPSQDN